MSADEKFLSRWSRRKREGKEEPVAADPPRYDLKPVVAGQAPAQPKEPVPLPPVDSLTPDSDFTPFLQPDVDPDLKRRALHKLFADPRFNVMDGMDVYIDDYTKSDPLPEGWLEKMEQVRHLGIFKKDPPPAEEAAAGAPADEPPADEQIAAPEQLVSSTAPVTSSEEIPAPPVGKSEGSQV